MSGYDTLIFDLDGTLLNTLDDLKDSVNYALREHGLQEMTDKDVELSIGTEIQMMEKAIPGGRESIIFADVLDAYRKHYANNLLGKTRPYPDILKLLERLHSDGYKMAIVSNKYSNAVKKLNEHFFQKYISVAIGYTVGVPPKPDPFSVFQALQELGSNNKQALYIGDSEFDIQTARNADMNCVCVSWGFRDKKFLKEHGAQIIADAPMDIIEILSGRLT